MVLLHIVSVCTLLLRVGSQVKGKRRRTSKQGEAKAVGACIRVKRE